MADAPTSAPMLIGPDLRTRLHQLGARLKLQLYRGEYLAVVMQESGTASGFYRDPDLETAARCALELAEARAEGAAFTHEATDEREVL